MPPGGMRGVLENFLEGLKHIHRSGLVVYMWWSFTFVPQVSSGGGLRVKALEGYAVGQTCQWPKARRICTQGTQLPNDSEARLFMNDSAPRYDDLELNSSTKYKYALRDAMVCKHDHI